MTEAENTRRSSLFERKHETSFQPLESSPHDLKKIQWFMDKYHKAEFKQLEAVKNYSNMTLSEVAKMHRSWVRILVATIIVSSVPFLISALLYYLSPIATSDMTGEYPFLDYTTIGVFSVVSLCLLVAIDGGRVALVRNVQEKSDVPAYIFLTALSICLSALGVAAVSYQYGSAQLDQIEREIEQARVFVNANSHLEGITAEEIEAKKAPYRELMATKGAGYYRKDLDRDMARIDGELADLNKYHAAKNTLENRNNMMSAGRSSNMLAHVLGVIIDSNAALAVMIIGILMIIGAEVMMFKATRRLGQIDIRVNITGDAYAFACHFADRASVMMGSSLTQNLTERFDRFYHAVGAIPTNVLSNYHAAGLGVGNTITDETVLSGNPLLQNQRSGLRHEKPDDAESDNKRRGNYFEPLPPSVLDSLTVEQALKKYDISESSNDEHGYCVTCDTRFKRTQLKSFCSSNHAKKFFNWVEIKKNEGRGKLTLKDYSLEELQEKHAIAKETKKGDSVTCPTCDTVHTNDSGFDIFCCSDHNRAYHNHVKREKRRQYG